MKNFYAQTSLPSFMVPISYAPSNEQAAWFAIAHTAANIRGVISGEARETFCKLLASKELFRGHRIGDYFYELMEVSDELAPKEIIRQAAKQINPEHAPTLFSIVAETLLAKGYLTEEDEELLDYIGKKLALNRDKANMIKEVLLLKYKGSCVYN